MAAGGRNVSARVIVVAIVCVSLVVAAVVLAVKGASASSAADRHDAATARAVADTKRLTAQLPASNAHYAATNRVYTRLLSDVRLFGPSFSGAVLQGYNLFAGSMGDIVKETNGITGSGSGSGVAVEARLVPILTQASGWIDLINGDADQFATDRAEIRTALAQRTKP